MNRVRIVLFSTAVVGLLGLAAARYGMAAPRAARLDEALLKAAKRDDTAKIKSLLAKGANPNARDKNGRTPLMLILQSSRYTGDYVIDQSRPKDNPDGTTSVTITMIYNDAVTPKTSDTRAVEALLAGGAQVNVKDHWGTTPVMLAAGHKTLACMKLLLAHGADIHAQSEDGGNALQWAVGHGHTEMLTFLLNQGLDPNSTRTSDGVTALMLEAATGNVKSVQALLDKGANKDARDKNGGTALKYARESHNAAVAQLLKEAGAKE